MYPQHVVSRDSLFNPISSQIGAFDGYRRDGNLWLSSPGFCTFDVIAEVAAENVSSLKT